MCLNKESQILKKLFVVSFGLILLSSVFAIELRNGDLIFQESHSEKGAGNAIKNVTRSAGEYQFTHVGIVYIPNDEDGVFVIEATTPVVRMVPLHLYLLPDGEEGDDPISVVGRLKDEYRHCIPGALREALQLLGKEYDYGFVLNNDKYYCSELIYDILLKANEGQEVFSLNRMTFKNNVSGKTDAGWLSFFESKGLEIPEGEWGINPGAMSTSSVIELLGEVSL